MSVSGSLSGIPFVSPVEAGGGRGGYPSHPGAPPHTPPATPQEDLGGRERQGHRNHLLNKPLSLAFKLSRPDSQASTRSRERDPKASPPQDRKQARVKLQGGTVPATGVGSASPIRMKHYKTEEGRTCCVCVCVRGYEGELAGPRARQRKDMCACVCVACAYECVCVCVCVRGGTRGSWQVHVPPGSLPSPDRAGTQHPPPHPRPTAW